MAVLVVVEGLSRELAEEVGAVQEAVGAAVSLQGTVGGCQGLGAAAAAEAAEDGIKKNISVKDLRRTSVANYDVW